MTEPHLPANLDRNEVVLCSDRVSLITGLEYLMKRYNGKWNGTVNVHAQLQLTRVTSENISGVTGTAQLSSVSLGLLSHRTSKYRAIYANCMQAWHSC